MFVKHDMTNPTYRSWTAMKSRCDCPTNERYHDYGGNGITYPAEWKDFKNFVRDMGERPSLDVSLDRRENNESYSKDNCRWATRVMQQKNQRDIRAGNESGVKGVSQEATGRWRTEGIYAGKRERLYQGYDFYQACLARWEWELLTWWHAYNGDWL